MSVFPGPSNAIVYAQFILQGRWRRMLLFAGGYGLLMAILVWVSTLGRAGVTRTQMQVWVASLAMLQLINLLVFGTFRVESAVRGDVTSRMLESHRLMPVPPLGGILGYLVGAPLQAFFLAIANFALGAVCCLVGGIAINSWDLFNGVLFLFALFIYAVILQLSFVVRGGFLMLLVLGFLAIGAASAEGLEIVPGLNLLLFPLLSRESIFMQLSGRPAFLNLSAIAFGYAGAIAAQVILAAIAVRVAMRRYLSSTIVGISPILGLLLLATWVALSLAGFHLPTRYYYRAGDEFENETFVTKVIASFVTAMLLAIFPIASAARSADYSRRTAGPLAVRGSARFSVLWTVGAATVILGALVFGCSRMRSRMHPLDTDATPVIVPTAVVLLNFLIAMAFFFVRGYLRRGWPWIIVLIWVPLTWIAPLVGDLIYRATSREYITHATRLITLSPPGALALAWSGSEVSLQEGIIGQILLTLIPAGLLLLARRKAAAKKMTGAALSNEKIQRPLAS